MASPREVEIPVTLSLSIPKQFGKTALAEQIQAFVIEAMAQAWDEGAQAERAAHSCGYGTADYDNPYEK